MWFEGQETERLRHMLSDVLAVASFNPDSLASFLSFPARLGARSWDWAAAQAPTIVLYGAISSIFFDRC